jgi:hypothetical protein
LFLPNEATQPVCLDESHDTELHLKAQTEIGLLLFSAKNRMDMIASSRVAESNSLITDALSSEEKTYCLYPEIELFALRWR